MIKKLRKLSNATILCISKDEELKNSINSLQDNVKEIVSLEDLDVELLKKNFDIMLIDCSIKNCIEIINEARIQKPLLPKIAIMQNSSDQTIVNCINGGIYSIITSPSDMEQLKVSLVMALNQSKRVDKICLDQDIYFDAYRERFYDNFGEITFTKFEYQVLKLLLDNSDKIISYEEIKEKVWKEKKMSIFTMRNVINKIRNKTYYNIIKNSSSKGYQIDTPR